MNENIIKIGQALWGERWQSEMAKALRISVRFIRYMTSGEKKIPPGVLRDLSEIAEQRGKDIEEILSLIKKLEKA